MAAVPEVKELAVNAPEDAADAEALRSPRRREPQSDFNLMKTLAAWCLGSSLYLVLCFVMFVANSALVVWMLLTENGHAKREWWVIAIEVAATSVIVAEVLTHLYVAGKAYWHECWNCVDFIVMVLCALSFIEYSVVLWGRDLAVDALLCLRYSVQAARLVALLRFANKRRLMHKARGEQIIDFEELPESSTAHGSSGLGAAGEPAPSQPEKLSLDIILSSSVASVAADSSVAPGLVPIAP